MENKVGGYSRANRANSLADYLLRHLDELNGQRENLADVIVGDLVERAIGRSLRGYPQVFNLEAFEEQFPALRRGLDRDGFTVEGGVLRRALPQAIDLPAADDEVHTLLIGTGSRYREDT